jgi:hypothetical protein
LLVGVEDKERMDSDEEPSLI